LFSAHGIPCRIWSQELCMSGVHVQVRLTMYRPGWSSVGAITTLLMSAECNILATKMGDVGRPDNPPSASIHHPHSRQACFYYYHRPDVIQTFITVIIIIIIIIEDGCECCGCWHRRHDDVLMNQTSREVHRWTVEAGGPDVSVSSSTHQLSLFSRRHLRFPQCVSLPGHFKRIL